MAELSSRGGSTAVAFAPDGTAFTKNYCARPFIYVVVTDHVKTPTWGWFEWCESIEQAEEVLNVKVPASGAAWGFRASAIVPCEMVHPWELKSFMAEKGYEKAGYYWVKSSS